MYICTHTHICIYVLFEEDNVLITGTLDTTMHVGMTPCIQDLVQPSCPSEEGNCQLWRSWSCVMTNYRGNKHGR